MGMSVLCRCRSASGTARGGVGRGPSSADVCSKKKNERVMTVVQDKETIRCSVLSEPFESCDAAVLRDGF